jgi:hypothetical protein
MKKLGLLLAGFAVLALGACTSTRITSSWKASDAQVQRDQKIVVMALVPERERALRAQMESYTVEDLQKKGYNAVSSLKEYGPQAFVKMKEKDVLNKLRSSDASQVMTIVLLDKGKERSYVPGNMGYPPFGYYRFGPYYSMWNARMYSPGYYTVNTRYSWESNLYDLKGEQLLYSVQTESFDPPTTERMAVLFAQQIVKDMTRQQLLSKK